MQIQEEQHQAYDCKALLKDFDSLLKIARRVGPEYFEEETIEQLAHQTRIEFEKIIPLLPYVGGKKSLFTNLTIQAGQTIAFYRACKNRGLEKRQIGELLYVIAEAQIQSVSRIKK